MQAQKKEVVLKRRINQGHQVTAVSDGGGTKCTQQKAHEAWRKRKLSRVRFVKLWCCKPRTAFATRRGAHCHRRPTQFLQESTLAQKNQLWRFRERHLIRLTVRLTPTYEVSSASGIDKANMICL